MADQARATVTNNVTITDQSKPSQDKCELNLEGESDDQMQVEKQVSWAQGPQGVQPNHDESSSAADQHSDPK